MIQNLRVVGDSNILISAARSRTSVLQALWTLPGVDILVSQYVIGEVSKHLSMPEQRARLWQLLYVSHLIEDGTETELPASIELPEKDRPILQSAMTSRADILVTGDFRHFGTLFGKTIEGVFIESTSMFKARYPEDFDRGVAPE